MPLFKIASRNFLLTNRGLRQISQIENSTIVLGTDKRGQFSWQNVEINGSYISSSEVYKVFTDHSEIVLSTDNQICSPSGLTNTSNIKKNMKIEKTYMSSIIPSQGPIFSDVSVNCQRLNEDSLFVLGMIGGLSLLCLCSRHIGRRKNCIVKNPIRNIKELTIGSKVIYDSSEPYEYKGIKRMPAPGNGIISEFIWLENCKSRDKDILYVPLDSVNELSHYTIATDLPSRYIRDIDEILEVIKQIFQPFADGISIHNEGAILAVSVNNAFSILNRLLLFLLYMKSKQKKNAIFAGIEQVMMIDMNDRSYLRTLSSEETLRCALYHTLSLCEQSYLTKLNSVQDPESINIVCYKRKPISPFARVICISEISKVEISTLKVDTEYWNPFVNLCIIS